MARNDWKKLDIDNEWYANVDEVALEMGHAAMENCFLTDKKSVARFPGLVEYVNLPDNGRVYLSEWRGDMIAATSNGRFYRIDRYGNVEDRTKVPITGGRRVIFADTTDFSVMAAGGDIIYFDGNETEILSEDAPRASYVVSLDNFVIADEIGSGRWRHSNAGAVREWDPLDVFAAESIPDNIMGIMRTDFRELLFLGQKSIEQFERLASGDPPFYRRWALGEGLYRPYLLLFADNGTWTVNKEREFVRFSGQTSEPRGGPIGRQLESNTIDEAGWGDAWIGGYPNRPLHILGHKFILMQLPNAVTPYGTKGLTLVYDYQHKRWFTLYDWDAENATPSRWPGWSHYTIDGKVYVGGEGKIYVLSEDQYANDGRSQRMYFRTGNHYANGHMRIDGWRARVKRGIGTNVDEPKIRMRATRDRTKISRWIEKGLGRAGHRETIIETGGLGMAYDWQFEFMATDNCAVELSDMTYLRTRLRN